MKPIAFLFVCITAAAAVVSAQECADCHQKVTPGIVKDWRLSKHAEKGIACASCHGTAHTKADDAGKADIPTPETCNFCHREQVTQFEAGKHSKCWKSMNAMPTIHMQPTAHIGGLKGCGGCHKMGLKSEEDIRRLKKESGGYGVASCDACHTRHQFSVKEAKEPQACLTCHMGFDHPQWEMYSTSKHGVRHLLKQTGNLPEDTAAPTCQFCHLPGGTHTNRTAWGFLALRLPMPEDKEWAADRTTILQGIGVLDMQGKATPRLDSLLAIDIIRTTEEDFQKERARISSVCLNCHSATFARKQIALGDSIVREGDRLMAEGIKIVAALYRDRIIVKPKTYASSYPDVLTFHDAPTVVEQKLFLMFSEHRMRGFQGAFHMNPDYAYWYGWSAMKQDLTEIKELSAQMRKNAGRK